MDGRARKKINLQRNTVHGGRFKDDTGQEIVIHNKHHICGDFNTLKHTNSSKLATAKTRSSQHFEDDAEHFRPNVANFNQLCFHQPSLGKYQEVRGDSQGDVIKEHQSKLKRWKT